MISYATPYTTGWASTYGVLVALVIVIRVVSGFVSALLYSTPSITSDLLVIQHDVICYK